MRYEWDQAKNETNTIKHGVSFEAIYGFELDDAMIWDDTRKAYGEPRKVALGFIHERLFCCIFNERGDKIRIISLRKANNREIRKFNGG